MIQVAGRDQCCKNPSVLPKKKRRLWHGLAQNFGSFLVDGDEFSHVRDHTMRVFKNVYIYNMNGGREATPHFSSFHDHFSQV